MPFVLEFRACIAQTDRQRDRQANSGQDI